MLAHSAILSKIYHFQLMLITVKCLFTQNVCFVFYITDMFKSLSLFLYQLHIKTPLIYTKVGFNILMLAIGFTQTFRTGNIFWLASGYVDQIPNILDSQAKFLAVIIFIKMPQQPCHPSRLSYKFNFVFWML